MLGKCRRRNFGKWENHHSQQNKVDRRSLYGRQASKRMLLFKQEATPFITEVARRDSDRAESL